MSGQQGRRRGGARRRWRETDDASVPWARREGHEDPIRREVRGNVEGVAAPRPPPSLDDIPEYTDLSDEEEQTPRPIPPLPRSPFCYIPDIIDVGLTLKLIFGVFFAYSTNFVPDEFWQSTEVAHVLAFKRGHMTWEWYVGLRSYLIPAMISSLYQALNYLGLVEGSVLLYVAPQIFQACLSAIALKVYKKYCIEVAGKRVGTLAYYLMLTNWFTSYCFARTISNTTELSLNMICLYFFQKRDHAYFVVLLVINCFIRPTAAIFWLPFFPDFVMRFSLRQVLSSIFFAALTAFYMVTLDMFYYRTPTLTPWEFFKFNYLAGGNEEFGVHNHFWYFYSALPCILGPAVGFYLFGLFSRGPTLKLGSFSMFYIIVYSAIGHKEIRFLLPVLPLVFIVMASSCHEFRIEIRNLNLFGSNEARAKFVRYLYNTYLVLNLIASVFFGVFHLRGFRAVSGSLQEDLPRLTLHRPEVWIMAPCYSMPVFTYINYRKADFVYYICAPRPFQEVYDTERAISTLIMQDGPFELDEMLSHVMRKQVARGSPDWIITYSEYARPIINTLALQDNSTTYFPKYVATHTYIGDFPRRVVLLQRAEKKYKNLVPRMPDTTGWI